MKTNERILAVVGLVLVLVHGGHAYGETLTFEQLNLIGIETTTDDSSVGQVTIQFTGYAEIRYFNLNVDGRWVVQNMSIASLLGQGVSQSVATMFDLGVSNGTDVTSLDYVYTIDANESDSMPTGSTTAGSVSDLDYRYDGEGGIDLGTPDPVAPPVWPMEGAASGGFFAVIASGESNGGNLNASSPNMPAYPNQAQGQGQCAPGSVSNSLGHMQNNGLIDPNLPTSIGNVSGFLGFSKKRGSTPPNWYLRKKLWLAMRGINTSFIEGVTDADLALLAAMLNGGQAVEMDKIGHVVSVVGLRKKGEKIEIDYFSDNQQWPGGSAMRTSRIRRGPGYRKTIERFIIQCPATGTADPNDPNYDPNTAPDPNVPQLDPNDPNSGYYDPNYFGPNYDPNRFLKTAFSDRGDCADVTYGSDVWSFRRPVISEWDYATGGTTYWVDPNGDDTNDGSLATPFATIQKGVDATIAGDIVYVNPGTYDAGFTVSVSGTAPEPIIISCAPGALGDVTIKPLLAWYGFGGNDPNDPNDDTWGNADVVSVVGVVEHVWVNGLVIVGPLQSATAEMKNSNVNRPAGVGFRSGAGNGCRVTNCVVANAMGSGICELEQGGMNILIEGNVVLENGLNYDDSGISCPAPGSVINGNISFKIDPLADPRPQGGIEFRSAGGIGGLISRNICFANDCGAGILIRGDNCHVYHNNCVSNVFGLRFAGTTGSGNVIRNNIFSRNTTDTIYYGHVEPNDQTIDHNHFFDPEDPNEPGTPPMFVDEDTGDFRLYGLSPCVDAGADLSAEFAAAGLPYLYYDPNRAGTAPDIGAFEYIPGDNNGDGKCNIDDYITLIGNYNSAGAMADGDTNGDGQVNIDDYIDVIGNYGYEFGAAAAAPAGDSVALGVSVAVVGNIASASITGDTYGNTSYTYVWTATSATNTVYAYGGPIATFNIDEPGQYVVTVTVFGNVGGKATAVHRYLTVE